MTNDLISRSDALKAVDNRHEELLHDTEYRRKHCQIDLLGIKKHILAIPPIKENTEEWTPIKTRPLTEEEKQNAIEEHGIDPNDLEYPFAWHFDCELPEPKEGEQSVDVLVTTDLGFVKVTNFFIDYLGCPCFEDMDEAGEFVAWMPLPEGYKKEVDNEDS